MEMCYNGAFIMPANYVVVNEDEMTYIDAGWNIQFRPTKRWGVYSGVDVILTATVSDCAWIVAAGAAFIATVGALGLAIPVIGPIISAKACIIGCAFVAVVATIVATNDKACKTSFSVTRHIGF